MTTYTKLEQHCRGLAETFPGVQLKIHLDEEVFYKAFTECLKMYKFAGEIDLEQKHLQISGIKVKKLTNEKV